MAIHKDNEERVRRETKRIAAIEQRCQDAIRHIMDEEGLEARIVFYPAPARKEDS